MTAEWVIGESKGLCLFLVFTVLQIPAGRKKMEQNFKKKHLRVDKKLGVETH